MIKKLMRLMVLAGLTLVALPAPQASAALPYCYSSCPLYGGSDLADCWCLNRVPTNCAEWSQCQEYWGNP